MNISIFSIVMAILSGNILILIAVILSRFDFIVIHHGDNYVLWLCIMALIRILLPVEISSTHEIEISVYNLFSNLLRRLSLNQQPEFIGLWVLVTIWVVVAGNLFLRFCLQYIRTLKQIHSLASVDVSDNETIACQAIKCKLSIKTQALPNDIGPALFGLIHPTIILPNDNFEPKELRHVIEHEYQHYRLGHMWIRLVVNVTCILFWYNPLIYFLRKHIFYVLELHCDSAVIRHKTGTEILDYAETLLKYSAKKNISVNKDYMNFSNQHSQETLNRFRHIFRTPYGSAKLVSLIVGVLTCVVFVMSYSIILQPKYPPPIESSGIGDVGKNDFVENEDGTYTVYLDGESIVISSVDYANLFENE